MTGSLYWFIFLQYNSHITGSYFLPYKNKNLRTTIWALFFRLLTCGNPQLRFSPHQLDDLLSWLSVDFPSFHHTADGRNPPPPGMNKTLYINKAGLTTNLNWLAGFLNHQQPTVVSNALNLKGLVLDSKNPCRVKILCQVLPCCCEGHWKVLRCLATA